MYSSLDQVFTITGYEVDQPTLIKAQMIVEAYTGRLEQQVENPVDRVLLGRATAYQAAYIKDNGAVAFEQMAASAIGQNNSTVQFKANDFTAPWIAPLAVIALKNLSWNRAKSVTTGSMFPFPVRGSWLDWWSRW